MTLICLLFRLFSLALYVMFSGSLGAVQLVHSASAVASTPPAASSALKAFFSVGWRGWLMSSLWSIIAFDIFLQNSFTGFYSLCLDAVSLCWIFVFPASGWSRIFSCCSCSPRVVSSAGLTLVFHFSWRGRWWKHWPLDLQQGFDSQRPHSDHLFWQEIIDKYCWVCFSLFFPHGFVFTVAPFMYELVVMAGNHIWNETKC